MHIHIYIYIYAYIYLYLSLSLYIYINELSVSRKPAYLKQAPASPPVSYETIIVLLYIYIDISYVSS